MTSRQIENYILETFDRSVMELSQTEYRDLLGNLIDQLQSRLDCVEAELEVEGDDE